MKRSLSLLVYGFLILQTIGAIIVPVVVKKLEFEKKVPVKSVFDYKHLLASYPYLHYHLKPLAYKYSYPHIGGGYGLSHLPVKITAGNLAKIGAGLGVAKAGLGAAKLAGIAGFGLGAGLGTHYKFKKHGFGGLGGGFSPLTKLKYYGLKHHGFGGFGKFGSGLGSHDWFGSDFGHGFGGHGFW